MSTESVSVGSWKSPTEVGKFISKVGLPSALLIALLVACFLVVTGLLKTPLMEGMTIIKDVKAAQEEQNMTLGEIRDIIKVHCENDADTPEKMQKCNQHTGLQKP
jgi:hypothetical protein